MSRCLRLITAACVLAVGCLDAKLPEQPKDVLPNDDVTSWFLANGQRLVSTAPIADDADLARFMEMVGAARVIGAGEGTHGTREFFELKHRLFRSLVLRRAGISAFAIEASMPDAVDLDRYVRDGVGDPARALSHLYFWTWRTQEVLDLVKWLREYNATVPTDQRVGFYGIDMQYPGGAVRRVLDWIPTSLSSVRDSLASAYGCLMPFVNDEAGEFARNINNETQATRDRCLAGARAAADLITARAAELRAATSADAFELHARLAVTVVQWATRAAGLGGIQYRDFALAENARWLLRRVPGRVYLWAHNAHISRASGTMGRSLRDSLGANYVNFGFMFDSGSFNARPSASDPPMALTTGRAREDSYEAYLRQFKTVFYFDVRAADTYESRLFMLKPKGMREIGAVYFADVPSSYIRPVTLADEYDLIFFVPVSSPTRLLPFTP